MVQSSRTIPENVISPASADLTEIARLAADLVPDGATLQFGIGAVPESVLGALTEHNDLGIHSGILTDAAVELIERGVVTNARKTSDRGQSRCRASDGYAATL